MFQGIRQIGIFRPALGHRIGEHSHRLRRDLTAKDGIDDSLAGRCITRRIGDSAAQGAVVVEHVDQCEKLARKLQRLQGGVRLQNLFHLAQ